jgi:Tfp pilus assembly protein PilW
VTADSQNLVLSHQTLFQKGTSAMMDFLSRTEVMIGMVIALVVLIGVMIFLRMKPRDDD